MINLAPKSEISLASVLDGEASDALGVRSKSPGPPGSLPLDDAMLRDWSSGDLFGLSQNAGMGWKPEEMVGPQYLILSTQGGLRAPDGTPIALGYHTGHWEVGLLVEAAARELKNSGGVPFAGYCSDPCDGRTQGTVGMFDSLPFRNDAAVIFRRMIRSLPTRRGVIGVATCDKGLPAMMMALAGTRDLPCVLVPAASHCHPSKAKTPPRSKPSVLATFTARSRWRRPPTSAAAPAPRRAAAANSSAPRPRRRSIAEALGLSLPHSALAPSGQPIWLDMARRSARALMRLDQRGLRVRDILTEAALHNAMVVHAAFGGSTNLLLHVPAIALAAGVRRPTVHDWEEVNRRTPRLVDALPNGPVGHPTVQVFLAGGVPEVMLHLRELGLLDLTALTATGEPLEKSLAWWEKSDRRRVLREMLYERDGINPDDVIMSPARAKSKGLTSTVCFPRGNLAPEGSVIKSTAIDPCTIDADRVYRKVGPARVFYTERDAIAAIKAANRPPNQARRRARPLLPWTDGLRDGRDVPDHFSLKAS